MASADSLGFQEREHIVPSGKDFNEILDQLFLLPTNGLIGIFSNVRTNGQFHDVDVTRRIKKDTIMYWPPNIRDKLMEILINFSLREFSQIVRMIHSKQAQKDVYAVEKQMEGITLPLNTHIFLIQQALPTGSKLVRKLTNNPVKLAILVFAMKQRFDREIRRVSMVVKGGDFEHEPVDRGQFDNYELPKKSRQEKRFESEAPVAAESMETARRNEAIDVVGDVLTKVRKIGELNGGERNLAIEYLKEKKKVDSIMEIELRLLVGLQPHHKF